jgi:hypothetical protein
MIAVNVALVVPPTLIRVAPGRTFKKMSVSLSQHGGGEFYSKFASNG